MKHVFALFTDGAAAERAVAAQPEEAVLPPALC